MKVLRSRSLRHRILFALGLPLVPACHETPPPGTPPGPPFGAAVPTPPATAAIPSASIAPSEPGAAPEPLRCGTAEVRESLCGLLPPDSQGGSAGLPACGATAQGLIWIGERRAINARALEPESPDLVNFSFDAKGTSEYAAVASTDQVNRRCCYHRCAPLRVVTNTRATIPQGRSTRLQCIPAPAKTQHPSAAAPQCPAGVELPISHYGARHGFDNAPIKRATDTECCYEVLEPCTGSRTELPDGQCVYPTRGRPLREGGVAVVAETTARPGWTEAITVGDCATGERQRAAEAWAREGALEHASVASFARFALELMALAAPAQLVEAALEAARDEVRHAAASFGIASAFAGELIGPGPLAVSTGLVATDLVQLAEACLRDGCVGETVAALEAAEAGRQTNLAEVSSVLARIADDEARHAELAYRVVAWALREGRAPVRSIIERTLAEVHAELAVSTLSPANVNVPVPVDDDRFGVLSPTAALAVRRHALSEVVAPCLTSLLTTSSDPASARAQP